MAFYDERPGMVMLSDRKLRVQRARSREGKDLVGRNEVEIPAYAAVHNHPRLSTRMLDILMRGVSTRSTSA